MKISVLYFILLFMFSSCDLFNKNTIEGEPSYTAKIVWDSGLYSNSYGSHTVYEDFIYFYERPPEYTTVNIYSLTKLDAKTGRLIWRSLEFSNIVPCQPAIIGEYVYVFLEPNYIVSFNKETGEHTAIIEVDIEERNFEMNWNVIAYQKYIYMGLWRWTDSYFVRLDLDLIKHNNNFDEIQIITPEILWEPEFFNLVTAKPVVYNNVIYTCTSSPGAIDPVEIAGFDTNTGQIKFYITFGGSEDNVEDIFLPETGAGIVGNPIFIHNNILYFLRRSISAWNINTGEKLYRHVFTNDIPIHKLYAAASLQPIYYKGRIYYTNDTGDLDGSPMGFRNIHCIDASTGKLVWNAIAKYSESLITNPIIAHDRLYISQYHGFFVYNPVNGKLIGVDRSFCGAGLYGRNILYNDYMICIQEDDYGDGKLVAVYVGK